MEEVEDALEVQQGRALRRPQRLRARRVPLSVPQILGWVDEHHGRTGRWPNKGSGAVAAAAGETWCAVHLALLRGGRGLPGGETLAQLLLRERGVGNHLARPPLTVAEILGWADDHRARTGRWPGGGSGPVAAAPGEVWVNVEAALAVGCRGLPGGDTLARLLARERGARNRKALPALTEEGILTWADAFHAARGRWPSSEDGPVEGAEGETWAAADAALYGSSRGLPGGDSLARLLARHRGRRNKKDLPRLTEGMIVEWAEEHRRRTGDWPHESSGPVEGVPGEVWLNLTQSLREGLRGLPGGDTLARLLARRAGATHARPPGTD